MPFYQYECAYCLHSFEEFQKMRDEPLEICPKCKEHTLQKVISAPAIIFKGTGWTPKYYPKQNV